MEPSQILLLQPWVEDFYATDCRIQPIGLAYLAGSLKQRFPDLDVQIYDTLAGGEKRSIAWPKEFRYLKPYYGHPDSSPFSLFHQYYRFGQNEDKIFEQLQKYNPVMIGISALFTPYYRQSLALAEICKKVFGDIPIVMGGNHATLHPETLLLARSKKDPEQVLCDYVIRGEAESSFCLLYEQLKIKSDTASLKKLVPNLICQEDLPNIEPKTTYAERLDVWKQNLAVPIAPDRNALAHPLYSGLDPDLYTYNNERMSFLVTSRSCPHRCSFCSIHAVFGTHYTMRDPLDILNEIQERVQQGVRHFDIEDDNFTFSRKNTIHFLNALIGLNLDIRLSAMNGVSYISLDQEILDLMWQAGFRTLNLALVSSDKMVLEFSSRPHTLDKFFQITQQALAIGYTLTIYGILGMPGQSLQEMVDTLLTLADTQCLMGASPFYFTPGSPIHHRQKNNTKLHLASHSADPYFSARLTAMDVESDLFDREDIYTLFRLTRVFNYIKSGIDEGLNCDDVFFEKARLALRGAWFAESKMQKAELPFSLKIRDLLAIQLAKGISIKGFKTANSLTFK
jgi:radical SAM superfamily enzyme YgiQ (UPF0313 family)